MTIRLNKAARNAAVGQTGLAGAFKDGVILLYSGPQPTSAESAPTGTLLAKVTANGGVFTHGVATNGLNFIFVDGALQKDDTPWLYKGEIGGTIGWARFLGNQDDDGSANVNTPRLDMSVGRTGQDMTVSNPVVEVGAQGAVTKFILRMRESA